jgi:hypothetical protein
VQFGVEDREPQPVAAESVAVLAGVPVPARFAADQLKKLVTAVASSGEADVARFW